MAITSEAWSFLEMSIFIDSGSGLEFLGFATDIAMSITYNAITCNAGRFSSDKIHYITTKDIEINISAIWFADDVEAFTPFKLYGDDGSYEDTNRDDTVTFYLKLVNQDNWDGNADCITPDPDTYDEIIEVVGKIAGYDISGNDPDTMVSKIRILGQKMKVHI